MALLPRILEKTGQLDILHANAGTYIGGDLVNANTATISLAFTLACAPSPRLASEGYSMSIKPTGLTSGGSAGPTAFASPSPIRDEFGTSTGTGRLPAIARICSSQSVVIPERNLISNRGSAGAAAYPAS